MPRKKEVVQDETVSLTLALKELCESKGLPKSVVIDAMTEALKKAYFKFSGDYSDSIIKVNIDLDTGSIKMSKIKNVVADIQDDVFETDPEEAYEETGVHYNVGDVVETPIDINEFKRAAAMLAKNVFKQKLREAEKQLVVEQYQDKVGDIISGTVEAVEEKHCIIKVGHTSAYLSKAHLLPGEKLRIGSPITVYVEEVVKNAPGTPIVVSRTNPRFVTRLMEKDIDEINKGLVEIKGIARKPGERSKVAVYSNDPFIDPSGACIGIHGARINRVLIQIAPEKIDVINYNENPLLYVADALKPAQVIGVQLIDESTKACRAIVADDQYSLAIGKNAQNVNLAVRLTNWKIDIKSLSDAENAGYEYQTIEELKFMEQAKKQRTYSTNTIVSPVESTANKEEEPIVEDTYVEDTTSTTIEEPVKEETPVVESKKENVEEEIVVTPTKKAATTDVFSKLEAAYGASSKTTTQETPKKKWAKKTDKTEDEEEKTPTKPTTPVNVLPVYTEEELRALEEEEAENEENSYDEDDIDLDEFDKYYDN